METYTIEQLIGKVGEVISRVEVKITAVYERKTGEGRYGPWSLQNGEIEDSTGKMKVVFSKMSDASNYNGRLMIMRSSQGKNGLTGLMVKKSEYKGKESVELWVSPSAILAPKGEDVNFVEDSPRPPKPIVLPSALLPSQVSHEDRKLGLAIVKNRLTQIAGLYDLCWKTVNAMDCSKGTMLQEDDLKDITTTLFIQSCREGLADKMPIRTTEKFFNEEALKAPSVTGSMEPEEFDEGMEKKKLAEDDIPF